MKRKASGKSKVLEGWQVFWLASEWNFKQLAFQESYQEECTYLYFFRWARRLLEQTRLDVCDRTPFAKKQGWPWAIYLLTWNECYSSKGRNNNDYIVDLNWQPHMISHVISILSEIPANQILIAVFPHLQEFQTGKRFGKITVLGGTLIKTHNDQGPLIYRSRQKSRLRFKMIGPKKWTCQH